MMEGCQAHGRATALAFTHSFFKYILQKCVKLLFAVFSVTFKNIGLAVYRGDRYSYHSSHAKALDTVHYADMGHGAISEAVSFETPDEFGAWHLAGTCHSLLAYTLSSVSVPVFVNSNFRIIAIGFLNI